MAKLRGQRVTKRPDTTKTHTWYAKLTVRPGVVKSAHLIGSLPLVLPAVLLGLGIVCLRLVLTRQFYLWNSLLFGVPVVVCLALLAFRVYDKQPPKDGLKIRWSDVVVVLGILLWVGVNTPLSAEHVFTDRDPATYAVAGAWLATHSSLHIPVPDIVHDVLGLQASSLGFGISTTNPQEIYAQGAHLLPALLGFFGKILGVPAVLYLNVAFGGAALLAFYSFARLVLRPRWAVLSVAILAGTLPLIYFSRDTYTEPLTLAFVFAALAYIWYGRQTKSLLPWLLAGLSVGGAVLLRTDIYMLLAALGVFVAIYLATAPRAVRSRRLQQAAAAAVPAAVLAFVGWFDVTQLSSGYYADVRTYILLQLLVVCLVTIGGTVVVTLAWNTRLLDGAQRLVRHVYTRRLLLGLLALFFAVLTVRAVILFGLAFLGRADSMNVAVFSAHTTVLWVVWYIGPVLAVAGVIQLIRGWPELLSGDHPELLPLFLILSVACALYLLDPGISPDQVWASRRFLPVIFPGFIILGTLLLQQLAAHQRVTLLRRTLPTRQIGFALGVLALGLPLLTSLPFWRLKPYSELAQIEAVCQETPSNAVVVWAGDEGSYQIQPTQAFCDVDSVATTATGTQLAAQLPQLEAAAAAEHKIIYLGANATDSADLPASFTPQMTNSISYYSPEETYKRFPLLTVQGTTTIVMSPESQSVATRQ